MTAFAYSTRILRTGEPFVEVILRHRSSIEEAFEKALCIGIKRVGAVKVNMVQVGTFSLCLGGVMAVVHNALTITTDL